MLSLLNLLAVVLLLGLIFYLIYWAVEQIPLPAPFNVVARVILALLAVVFLLSFLLGGFHARLLE